MSEFLNQFLSKTFDFAGTFAPASLPFEAALIESASFSGLKSDYLIANDFVTEFANLKELSSEILFKSGFKSTDSFKISILGQALSEDSTQNIQQLDLIRQFNLQNSSHAPSPKVVSYEIKIEQQILSSATQLLQEIEKIIKNSKNLNLAFEPDLSKENWQDVLLLTSKTLGLLKKTYTNNISFKIRGSGPTAIDNLKVLAVIKTVIDNQLNFKATAGLHHPIIEKEKYNNNFGFLNLKIAYILRKIYATDFNDQLIFECLQNSQNDAFKILPDKIVFKSFEITQKDLDLLSNNAFSIGSCSIREPVADLKRLWK